MFRALTTSPHIRVSRRAYCTRSSAVLPTGAAYIGGALVLWRSKSVDAYIEWRTQLSNAPLSIQ